MKVHVKKGKSDGTYDFHIQTTMDGRTVRVAHWSGQPRESVRLIVSQEAGFIQTAKADAKALWKAQVKSGRES